MATMWITYKNNTRTAKIEVNGVYVSDGEANLSQKTQSAMISPDLRHFVTVNAYAVSADPLSKEDKNCYVIYSLDDNNSFRQVNILRSEEDAAKCRLGFLKSSKNGKVYMTKCKIGRHFSKDVAL